MNHFSIQTIVIAFPAITGFVACVVQKLALLVLVVLSSANCYSQKYELFEIENGELVWRNTYKYEGPEDSLRREVVSMLKSKIFTQHVVRNEIGYNGEIHHYTVNCLRYGRKYNNTPLIYWSGEWSGKFIIEVADHSYRVTIYGLYFENKPQQISRYQTSHPRKGFYSNEIWKKGVPHFKRNKLDDITFMSLSLRDEFDIVNYGLPIKD